MSSKWLEPLNPKYVVEVPGALKPLNPKVIRSLHPNVCPPGGGLRPQRAGGHVQAAPAGGRRLGDASAALRGRADPKTLEHHFCATPAAQVDRRTDILEHSDGSSTTSVRHWSRAAALLFESYSNKLFD